MYAEINLEAKSFYEKNGYVHIRKNGDQYISAILESKIYYESLDFQGMNHSFKNKEGYGRHLINILRDKKSKVQHIFFSSHIKELIDNLVYGSAIYTHAKLSFKEPGAVVDWLPHQDNGYKLASNLREGFAIFICLEDMSEDNGCLQVMPGSHKLGTLPHIRKVEHLSSGDGQLVLAEVPEGFNYVSLIASQGDVIIFNSNTIHKSGSSSNFSRRLALIAEVEPYRGQTLDDYGMVPIFAKGSMPFPRYPLAFMASIFNSLRLWFFIKRHLPKLAILIRKYRKI